MLKISTKGQYALLIMSELGEQSPGKSFPLRVLAHRHNMSVKYLEQILIKLGKAGLIEGTRGINGGYKLVKTPAEYTTGEILRAMEGDLCPCNEQQGNIVTTPGSREYWNNFEKAINAYVDSVTLDKLIEVDQAQETMYYI